MENAANPAAPSIPGFIPANNDKLCLNLKEYLSTYFSKYTRLNIIVFYFLFFFIANWHFTILRNYNFFHGS